MANWPSVSVNITPNKTSKYTEGESVFPDDSEMSDLANVKKMIDDEFDRMYPPFEPEIIHTLQKDYFLPALKVLSTRNGEFLSPQREVRWVNMELRARCLQEPFYPPALVNPPYSLPPHKAPYPDCDCGVYGSVNLEEVNGIIADQINKSVQRIHYHEELNSTLSSVYKDVNRFSEQEKPFSLCIVEPSPDADYILCRKGWKASHAFISEIIGQTMEFHQAEELLSHAWRRNISLRSIYENW